MGKDIIEIIRSEEEYESVLKQIESLMDMDPNLGTPEADELCRLAELVEVYEDKYYPIDEPSSAERIAFRKEQEEESQ